MAVVKHVAKVTPSAGRVPSRERKREPTEKELESVLRRLEKEREKERESLLDDEVRQLCEEIDSAACCACCKG